MSAKGKHDVLGFNRIIRCCYYRCLTPNRQGIPHHKRRIRGGAHGAFSVGRYRNHQKISVGCAVGDSCAKGAPEMRIRIGLLATLKVVAESKFLHVYQQLSGQFKAAFRRFTLYFPCS